jgi:hypothetical protein
MYRVVHKQQQPVPPARASSTQTVAINTVGVNAARIVGSRTGRIAIIVANRGAAQAMLNIDPVESGSRAGFPISGNTEREFMTVDYGGIVDANWYAATVDGSDLNLVVTEFFFI